MEDYEGPDIKELEKRVLSEPDSASLYDRLLCKYFEDESLHGHPRRINHILACIERFARDSMCRTPYVQVDPKVSPEGFRAIEKVWAKLLDDNPCDVNVARGAANFFCCKDLSYAKQILRKIVDEDPHQADAWLDLGRYSAGPQDRLRFFQEARQRGAVQPNLLVWIAKAAVAAGEFDTAEAVGNELLTLVDAARLEYGDKLDWEEKNNAIWNRAMNDMGSRSAAARLVHAISAHAYHKHWGHTVLGHVALHRENLRDAIFHLKESGSVVGDPRLSSYGPSFTLAKALCEKGEWFHVATYLEACESFWDDERLPIWISMVQSHKLPDF